MFLLLARRSEAAEHFDPHGKRRESPAESFVVLKREHGSRREHGHLHRIAHRLERRAHGHFRFAVANIAAQQAVHRLRRFQIMFHVADGLLLIRRLLKFKRILKFLLPVRILGKGVTHSQPPLGIKRQELLGHIADRLLHARLARLPKIRPQPIELRRDSAQRLIFLNQIHARQRHVEPRIFGVAQQHEFARVSLDGDLPQPVKLPDAVIHVHYVIARLEIGEIAEE